jgi:hypothetical protein
LPNQRAGETADRDYFKIHPNGAGMIVIDVLNHPLANVTGVQVQLFYETIQNQVAIDLFAPYHLEYNGQPGTYYIYIFNDVTKCSVAGINCNIPYLLTVTYPNP